MGAGIVQVAAHNGLKVSESRTKTGSQFRPSFRGGPRGKGTGLYRVRTDTSLYLPVMTDVSDAALDNGRSIITKSLTRVARKLHPDNEAKQKQLLDDTFNNITTTTSAAEAVEKTDLVIEAIVENLETKQELFRRLDELAPKHTIFASNTSSLSISKIAETCTPERQTRFAGFHAFNPVPQMKLVSR